jgi:DNA-binding response OmpR family regulator
LPDGASEEVLVVLVVDDDDALRTLIVETLSSRGMTIIEASTGGEAIQQVRAALPDVVVLDVHLPGQSGLEVLRATKELGTDVKVILLTASGTEAERVSGLDLGADDYIVKPFSLRELEARVRAVARRHRRGSASSTLTVGQLEIDPDARQVTRQGAPVELTPKELDLLVFLASNPRHAFTRDELLRHVWASASAWQKSATVTEHVRRLRQKLEDDPTKPQLITTVRGAGYRFDADPKER